MAGLVGILDSRFHGNDWEKNGNYGERNGNDRKECGND